MKSCIAAIGNSDGDIVALRVENWKVVFMEQRAPGTLRVWAEPDEALDRSYGLLPLALFADLVVTI